MCKSLENLTIDAYDYVELDIEAIKEWESQMAINKKKVAEALKHPNKLGAGAKKRKKLNPQEKVASVMKEWKRGTLKSGGSGKTVKSQKMAIAIALSESGQAKKKKGKG